MVNISEFRENFQGRVFSYSVVSFKEKALREYCFFRADFVRAKIANYDFINCDMSHIDAKGAYFKGCKFIDCSFKHSNFADAVFEDCQFIHTKDHSGINIRNYSKFESLFEKSGMFGTVFKNCKFENCYIKGVGFRYSLFDKCKFRRVMNYSVSFENAIIKNCDFDIFDIRSSAVYGLTIENSRFEKIVCRFEKSIQIIGIDKIYKEFNYYLKNDPNSTKSQLLLIFSKSSKEKNDNDKKIDILESLKNLMKLKKSHFETLNLLYILDKIKSARSLQYDTIKNRLIQINNLYPNISNIEKLVLAYIDTITEDESIFIDLQDINMMLKLLFFQETNLIYAYDMLLTKHQNRTIEANAETNIIEKSIYNYYKHIYKTSKLKARITIDEKAHIDNVIATLKQIKEELSKKGLYETYHYQLSYVSSGSIEIVLEALVFVIAALISGLNIKYSKITLMNEKKEEFKLEYNGSVAIKTLTNEIKRIIGFTQDRTPVEH
ncbi:pentapeptide repeat-containing protein [Hippea alviniae]|uniref:pentapeptide repeat-containing protein n=1 Tax=Hippea alviniae TaxID=1279027 RepID=UPI0003B3172F|nr:pentapeptide repeat-containing protein [Hippea alviniae]